MSTAAEDIVHPMAHNRNRIRTAEEFTDSSAEPADDGVFFGSNNTAGFFGSF